MKSPFGIVLITVVAGFVGGVSSHFFQSKPSEPVPTNTKIVGAPLNPFKVKAGSSDVAVQIAQIQKKLARLETQLLQIEQSRISSPVDTVALSNNTGEEMEVQVAALSDHDYLISIDVDPGVASEMLRRISQQQFRTLELRNLMRGAKSSDRQQYAEELRELNENRISVRSELGDERYDEYLIASGKNNRLKVSSVMAGSPAEAHGVENNDVFLYYDDRKIIDGNDLRSAALGGDRDGFANIEILRDGNRMNLVVPHGTLGVQFEAIQINPSQ